jgi:hypothetical protein
MCARIKSISNFRKNLPWGIEISTVGVRQKVKMTRSTGTISIRNEFSATASENNANMNPFNPAKSFDITHTDYIPTTSPEKARGRERMSVDGRLQPHYSSSIANRIENYNYGIISVDVFKNKIYF